MAKSKKVKGNGRIHKIKDNALELAVAGIGQMSERMDSEDVSKFCLEVATYIVDYEEPEDEG